MTSNNAIPVATDSLDPARSATHLYFRDGTAFGHPHARSSTVGRTWDDDQLLEAAHAGADGRDLHPDVLAALCRRYIDMVQDEAARAPTPSVAELQLELTGCRLALDEERNAHMGTMFAREHADDLYQAELAERVRIAQLHAELSNQLALVARQRDQALLERTLALHRCAGTTPAAITIALDRAARAVTGKSAQELGAELDRQVHEPPDDPDTVIEPLEDLHPAGVTP